MDIVTSTEIDKDTPDILRLHIREYLELLHSLGEGNIKPKHHHLLHYPTIMHLIRPLWHVASMRGEAKHKEGITISRTSISRVNVRRTV